jgi:hypothetical protein
MMLAETVEIEADLVGELDLLEQVAEPLGRALQVVVAEQVGGIFGEGVEADVQDLT